jgi:hypothetical protein
VLKDPPIVSSLFSLDPILCTKMQRTERVSSLQEKIQERSGVSVYLACTFSGITKTEICLALCEQPIQQIWVEIPAKDVIGLYDKYKHSFNAGVSL